MAYQVSEEKRNEWKQKAIENQNKARDLIKSVSDAYTKDPDQLAELLEFASKFYKYSINNTELIKAQNRGAVFVQSFEGWKKMDAHVKKGEHGMKIWVPVKVTLIYPDNEAPVLLSEATREQKMDYEAGIIKGRQILKYKLGTVFDVSQTDFPKEKLPEFYSVGFSSEDHAAISRGLEAFCKAHGFDVVKDNLSSVSFRGYCDMDRKKIVMNELLEDTQYLSTLSHEIGHMLQEHGNKEGSPSQKEFEADCISVVLQSYFGIELTDARKRHLSDHYNSFMDDLSALQPDLPHEEKVKVIDFEMDSSLKVFREFADEIRGYVDEEIKKAKESVAITETKADPISENPQISFSFTVYECQEFPSMGMAYTDIHSPEEAIKVYSDIPPEKRMLVGGISLIRDDGHGNKADMPLSTGEMIDLGMFDFYLQHTVDKEGISKIKSFCEAAYRNGFSFEGYCMLNLERYGKDDIAKACAAKAAVAEPAAANVMAPNRRHRGR